MTGAIAVTDDDIDAVLANVKTLWTADQHEEAINLLTEAIQKQPNARLYFERGRTFDYCDRDEEAIEDYTKAIELDPTKAKYYYRRGTALAYPLHRDEEAIADFEMALKLKPG